MQSCKEAAKLFVARSCLFYERPESENGAAISVCGQPEKFRCLVLLQHSAIVAHYQTVAVLLTVEGRSVSHHPLLRQYLPGR